MKFQKFKRLNDINLNLRLNHSFALQIMVQFCSDHITFPFKLKKSVLNIIKLAVFSFKKTFSPDREEIKLCFPPYWFTLQ